MSYRVGKNRIFYESNDSQGKDIKIEILNPLLQKSDKLQMNYFENNIFYIDVWFRNIGSHIIRVFENGVEKHKDILSVSEPGLIIYPKEGQVI